MLQTLSVSPARRSLEFGIYRDGDNNLDAIQESTLAQALRTSAADWRIEFTVEDTTRLHAGGDGIESGGLRTEQYVIADGGIGQAHARRAPNMSDEKNLRSLSRARSITRRQTARNRRGWSWSTTGVVTAGAWRLPTAASCRCPASRGQSPTVSPGTPPLIRKTPAAPSTASSRTNA